VGWHLPAAKSLSRRGASGDNISNIFRQDVHISVFFSACRPNVVELVQQTKVSHGEMVTVARRRLEHTLTLLQLFSNVIIGRSLMNSTLFTCCTRGDRRWTFMENLLH
jgi:hypothetical protein